MDLEGTIATGVDETRHAFRAVLPKKEVIVLVRPWVPMMTKS